MRQRCDARPRRFGAVSGTARQNRHPLPDYDFGAHALFAAVQRKDRATIDVLLEAGADINQRTDWWAGGFGVLDDCDPDMAKFLVERGARLDAHAVARLGMLPELRALVASDPGIARAAATGRLRCISPRRSRSRSFCSKMARKSMRATWITNRRRRNICCAWSKNGIIPKAGRTWRVIWYHEAAKRTF